MVRPGEAEGVDQALGEQPVGVRTVEGAPVHFGRNRMAQAGQQPWHQAQQRWTGLHAAQRRARIAEGLPLQVGTGGAQQLPWNLQGDKLSDRLHGGDLASTWVAKPEVHAEVRETS